MAEARCVRDLMTSEVRSVRRNDQLILADELMRDEEIRHLVVLDDDDAVCGIVSQRDIFRGALLRALGFGERAAEKFLESLLVKEVMTREPVTVGPAEEVGAAARLLHSNKVGCLPVVENDALVGIITATDLLQSLFD